MFNVSLSPRDIEDLFVIVGHYAPDRMEGGPCACISSERLNDFFRRFAWMNNVMLVPGAIYGELVGGDPTMGGE